MKKAERQQMRIMLAERAVLQQIILGACIAVCNRWKLEGQTKLDSTFPAMKLTKAEKRDAMRMITRFEKHRDELLATMQWQGIYEIDYRGKDQVTNRYHASVQRTVQTWWNGIEKHASWASERGKNEILWNLMYMALWELAGIYRGPWAEREGQWLLQTAGTFARWCIRTTSELILPMNKIWWETRDEVMRHTPLYWYWDESDKTELEEAIEAEPESQLARSVKRWRDEWTGQCQMQV